MNGTGEFQFTPQRRDIEIYIKSFRGRNGEHIALKKGDIVLIVGPNNSGKTTFINSLSLAIQNRGHLRGSLIFSELDLHISAPPEKVDDWLATYGPKISSDPTAGDTYLYQGAGWGVNQVKDWFAGCVLDNLHQLIVNHLNAANRTLLLNQTSTIFVTQSPGNALQRLLLDEGLEERLARLVKKAFGTGLVLYRGYGPQTQLHFGESTNLPGREHPLSPEYQRAVQTLPSLESQGDGIKAFVGIMAELLTTKAFFILIDEPELFLHPPQARLLGANLTREFPDDTQLFLATHSGDFVRGLINAEPSRVRILRVQRNPTKPRISEIDREQVAELWKDPLLRVSNVLDGLFHERVFVCEGDTDSRFYSAMVDAMASAHDTARFPDCAFVHGGGKGKSPVIAKALTAVNVDVGVIFDLDVLSDSSALSKTVEALGGNWSDIAPDWKLVVNAIETRKPESSTAYVKEHIQALLGGIAGEAFPQDTQRKITDLMRSANPWNLLKQGGISYLPPGGARTAWLRLDKKLKSLGVFVLPEGELESLYKLAAKGPPWIEKVLSESMMSSPHLEAARKFVSEFMAKP